MSYKARVPLASVRPSGQNPRRDFGDVGALARSIEATGGQPVNPIVVADVGDGADGEPSFRIVDGERRYRALLELGAEEADVLVCAGWGEAEEAVAMMATDDKLALSDEERARGFQGMLSLGVPDETVSGASGVDVGRVRRIRGMRAELPEQASMDAIIAACEFDDPADREAVLSAADPAARAAQIRRRHEDEAAREALRPLMESALPSLEWREGRAPSPWDGPDGLGYVRTVRTAADVDDVAGRCAGEGLVAWASGGSWSVWREVDEGAESRESAEAEAARDASSDALRGFLESVARWVCRIGSVPRDVAALTREGRGWHDPAVALGLDGRSDECPADADLASAMDSDPSVYEALVALYRMRRFGGIRAWSGPTGTFDERAAERADDLWDAVLAGGLGPVRLRGHGGGARRLEGVVGRGGGVVTSADDKLPQWIRLRTNDWDSPAGRYMLAGGRTSDWADYGRWFALRQLLATTPGAYVDASNQRHLGALARQLGFASPRACRSWLEALVECGAVSRTDWEEDGWVVDVDVANQQASYQDRVRVNRSNRAGRSRREGGGDDA